MHSLATSHVATWVGAAAAAAVIVAVAFDSSSHVAASAVAFPQPGFSPLGDGNVPLSFPDGFEPGPTADASGLFSGLEPSGANWTPVASPVVDASGNLYWAVSDGAGAIRLVLVTSANSTLAVADSVLLDTSVPFPVSSVAFTFFIGLGGVSGDVLVSSWISGSSTLAVMAVHVNSQDTQPSFGTPSDTLSYPTATFVDFDPVVSDLGNVMVAAALASDSSPCVLTATLSSSQPYLSAACTPVGMESTQSFYLSLAAPDASDLLLSIDGQGLRIAASSLPVTNSAPWTPLSSSHVRLRYVTGSPGFILAVDAGVGTISLFSDGFRNELPWSLLWTVSHSLSGPSLPAVIDGAHGRIFVCANVTASTATQEEGVLLAVDMASGVVIWSGSECYRDSTLLLDDGSILVSSLERALLQLVTLGMDSAVGILEALTVWSISVAASQTSSWTPVIWRMDDSETVLVAAGPASVAEVAASSASASLSVATPTSTSTSASGPQSTSPASLSSAQTMASTASNSAGATSSSGLETTTAPAVTLTPTSSGSPTESSRLSTGAIAGIAVAAAAVFIAALVAAAFLYARRRRHDSDTTARGSATAVPPSRDASQTGDSVVDGRSSAPMLSPLHPPLNQPPSTTPGTNGVSWHPLPELKRAEPFPNYLIDSTTVGTAPGSVVSAASAASGAAPPSDTLVAAPTAAAAAVIVGAASITPHRAEPSVAPDVIESKHGGGGGSRLSSLLAAILPSRSSSPNASASSSRAASPRPSSRRSSHTPERPPSAQLARSRSPTPTTAVNAAVSSSWAISAAPVAPSAAPSALASTAPAARRSSGLIRDSLPPQSASPQPASEGGSFAPWDLRRLSTVSSRSSASTIIRPTPASAAPDVTPIAEESES
ncbi:hypothetical protein HK405_009151, partial [Cladochytrium tenue]